MKEIWKGVVYGGVDYSEWLEVSNLGRIRNPKTGTIRKQNLLKNGYYFVSFSMGSRGNKKTIRVHKAIAETFISNPENKPIVNHIDGVKTNNSIDNLEWCTHSENIRHAFDTGLVNIKTGYDNKLFKLSEKDVEFIINNYKPRDKNFGARALGRKFNISHTSILKILKQYSS
jgi:hypothetical protein